MMTQHYSLRGTIPTSDGREANGVLVNQAGEWLGEVVTRIGHNDIVVAYEDEDGNFIPVPDNDDGNWFDMAQQIA